MDIINTIQEISESVQNYYGHNRMLVIILFCIMLAYLYFPEIKRNILYPTMLILFIIANPLLYEMIFSKIIFWRLLWMIPGTFIIAYVICQLIKVCKSRVKQLVVLCCICIFFAVSGDYVYSSENFSKTQNLDKLDEGTREVGEIILANCENPRCIMTAKYLSEIRQYSTDIELLYGRNAFNYITTADTESGAMGKKMEMVRPDYFYILERFKKYNCNIIVVHQYAPISDYYIEKYGLMELARVDESIIYKRR